jgi:hypothetical protein
MESSAGSEIASTIARSDFKADGIIRRLGNRVNNYPRDFKADGIICSLGNRVSLGWGQYS